MLPQLPFPALEEEQKRLLQAEFLEQYRQWRVAYEKAQPEFVIENVRFEHDPEWRNRIFSLQCAREQNHWIWKATNVAFNLSAAQVGAGSMLGGVGVMPVLGIGLLGVFYVLHKVAADRRKSSNN